MSSSSSHGRRHGRGALAAVALTALLALAGGPGAASSAGAGSLPTITVAITKSSVTVGGSLQSGGVNIVSTATGTKEAGVVLFQLKPGVSSEAFTAFLKSKASKDPNNADKYGSIVFAAEIPTGKTTEAQTTLAPGQYLALATEGEGPPKTQAAFTVAASAAPAALPAPQATERAIDFGFRGPTTLKVGELVRFENEGFVAHMNFALPVRGKKAARKLVKTLRSGKQRQSFKLVSGPLVSFQDPVSSGAYQQETITAKPGWYVQACFMETQDGRSHTLLGMERIIKITR